MANVPSAVPGASIAAGYRQDGTQVNHTAAAQPATTRSQPEIRMNFSAGTGPGGGLG
jgi:hypothetical protein